MTNDLDSLRALLAERSTKTQRREPTVIQWAATIDRATGETTLEYDEEMVARALLSPEDFIIDPVGKVTVVGDRPEPTFGELLLAGNDV